MKTLKEHNQLNRTRPETRGRGKTEARASG